MMAALERVARMASTSRLLMWRRSFSVATPQTRHSPSVFCLADDFSGACDTGVQFGLAGLSTKLVTMRPTGTDSAAATVDSFKLDPSVLGPTDVLVVDTESRSEDSALARDRISAAFDLCAKAIGGGSAARQLQDKVWFKKIDSSLRGPVAAELHEFMQRSGQRICFFCPAFPEIGRKTVSGFHTLDGMPVAEVRRNLMDLESHAIESSNLEAFLQPCGSETPWHTQQINLRVIREGSQAVIDLAQDYLSVVTPPEAAEDPNRRPFVFFYLDAEQQSDLKVIAEAASRMNPHPFLCGSAGLAKYVAEAFNVHGHGSGDSSGTATRSPAWFSSSSIASPGSAAPAAAAAVPPAGTKPAAGSASTAAGRQLRQRPSSAAAAMAAAREQQHRRLPRPVLLVVGSCQPNTLRQLDTLYASLSGGYRRRARLLEWVVEEDDLEKPLPPLQALERGDVAIVRLQHSRLGLATTTGDEGQQQEQERHSRALRKRAVHRVADIAKQLTELTKGENLAGFISTGGYMSKVFLKKLGALDGPLTIMSGLEERGSRLVPPATAAAAAAEAKAKNRLPQELPSPYFTVGTTAMCRLDHGPFKGLRCVTKGGRLGTESTFLTALARLQSEEGQEAETSATEAAIEAAVDQAAAAQAAAASVGSQM